MKLKGTLKKIKSKRTVGPDDTCWSMEEFKRYGYTLTKLFNKIWILGEFLMNEGYAL